MPLPSRSAQLRRPLSPRGHQRRTRIPRPRHSVHQPHPAPSSQSPTSSRRRSAPRAPRPLPDRTAPAFSRQPSRSAQLRRQPRPRGQRRTRIPRPRHSVNQPHPAPSSQSPTSSRRRSAPRAPRPLPDRTAPAFSRQPSRSAQLSRQPRPRGQRRTRIPRPRHSVQPTASGTELAIPDILPPPFRTARPQTTARPHRAGLLAPALPQRPAPPAAETPRPPASDPDPQATPQRQPTASGTELAIPDILPPPFRTARPQATARPHRAGLLAPALPQRPAPPAAETPRPPASDPDPQATPQRPTASAAESDTIPRTPDALHEVLHAHLPIMGAEYLTSPPMGDHFRTPIPGLSRNDGNRWLRAIDCAEPVFATLFHTHNAFFSPPPSMRSYVVDEFRVDRWHAWLTEHPDRRTHLADEILASVWPDYQRDHGLKPAPIPPTPAALRRVLSGHLRQLGGELVQPRALGDDLLVSIPGLGPTALRCVIHTLHDQIPYTAFAPPDTMRGSGAKHSYRCDAWSRWLDNPPDRLGYFTGLLTKAVWPVHQQEHTLDPTLRAPEPPEPPPEPSRPARALQRPRPGGLH